MKYQSVFDQACKLTVSNDLKKALQLAENTLLDAKKAENLEGQALMLKIMAQIQNEQGELEKTLETLKKLEPLYVQLNKKPEQMHTLGLIGGLFLELGKAECAEKCLIQVVENYENSETTPLEKANAFRAYAMSLEQRNQNKMSLMYWTKAKEEYKIIGLVSRIEECDSRLF